MSNRGVTKSGHAPASPLLRPLSARMGWDDLRYFLAVAEHGSLRAAAVALGTTVTTVGRRVEELESALGEPLVNRLRQGITLTPLGQEIVADVRDVSLLVGRIGEKAQSSVDALSGRVRLAVTEGLATYWLGPRLVELQQRFPFLTIDLISTMGFVDLARDEADIAIQLQRPSDLDMKAVRLGKLHLCFYMAEGYRRRYGMPMTPAELKAHRLILQGADQLDTQVLLDVAGIERLEGRIAFTTNTSSVHYMLIAKGAGIGILPTYANALGADLVPVDIGLRHAYDIWMCFHKDTRRSKAKAQVVNWLKDCFDPDRFPWFADTYHDPTDLARLPNDAWRINMLPPLRAMD